MSYENLAYMHLSTILPAFIIGTYLMLNRKGTGLHKKLGKIYMVLMLLTGVITLFMPAYVGPQLFGHFGFLHVFSIVVLVTVPSAYVAARKGNVAAHRGNMIGLYVGGILVAGAIAFMPGRMLPVFLFG